MGGRGGELVGEMWEDGRCFLWQHVLLFTVAAFPVVVSTLSAARSAVAVYCSGCQIPISIFSTSI